MTLKGQCVEAWSQQVALLEVVETFGRRGRVGGVSSLERECLRRGYWNQVPPLLFSASNLSAWTASSTLYSHQDVLLTTALNNRAKWLWTEMSEVISQNKPFVFWSWFSQAFFTVTERWLTQGGKSGEPEWNQGWGISPHNQLLREESLSASFPDTETGGGKETDVKTQLRRRG